ncbi:RUN domain-containing protein [Aphelenchoides bicaudatus]|nr:RUN domain-containing protein [Aphelenchoides bicaudatus]
MSAALEHAKNRIRRELDTILKLSATHSANGSLPSDVEQQICNVIEAIFIHGLLDAFFLKGSRYSKARFFYPDPNIWPLISKFIHVSNKKQISALKQIKTEIGKARGVDPYCTNNIYSSLNEGSLENYVQLISKDEAQLNQFYSKSAFLRDGEKVEALNGYLKALAKLPINSPSNSTVLNNWSPKPLALAGLITEKTPPAKQTIFSKQDKVLESSSTNPHLPRLSSHDDDERSSVYSHPSMLDQTEPLIRQSFHNLLPGTPEDSQVLNFQESQRSTDVIVRHKRGRIRSLSKSSNSSSTNNISRNLSLTAIAQEAEEVEIAQASKEETSEHITFKVGESVKQKSDELNKENGVKEEVIKTAVDQENEYAEEAEQDDRKDTDSDSIPLVPTDFEPTASSSFNDSSFSQAQSMSLHDELTISGFQDDSGVSGNSIQGFIWSSPARKISAAEHRSSFSSNSSSIPAMSFDAEMRSVLTQQTDENEMEQDKNVSLPESSNATEHLNDTCETLAPDVELVETDFIADTKSEDVVVIDEKETDEFGNERNVIQRLTKIQCETGLASQNFRCFSCLKSIGGSSFLPFKMCALDAKYYCEECMRRGIESPIPPRIILNWDHKPRPICRACKDFLKNVYDKPIIRLDRVNPLLYDNAPQLAHLNKMRVKLSLVAMYLLSCKKTIADDLKCRLHPHEYLYTDVNLYSLKDLEGSTTGALERRLKTVIEFAVSHVVSCGLCVQKGFVCELCTSRQVIYPFQVETTHRCKKCFSVFHQQCIKDKQCPKCERKAKKESITKEAEFMFK